MANEITYTDHGNLFIAAAMNQMLWRTIVDRSSLLQFCTYFGSVNGSSSIASKVGTAAFDDAMAAANTDEVTAPSNTDLGTGTVTITVARQVLKRVITDPYALVGGAAPGIEAFASDMADAAVLRSTDMVAALFSNFSKSKGTSGADLTVDDVSNAHYQYIQSRVPGRPVCVLAPIGLTDFLDSLRGEGGSAEFNPDTEALLSASDGEGFGRHGSWRGIEFWSCDSCPTSGSDRHGALFGAGAMGYMDGIPSDVLASAAPGSFVSVAPDGSPIFVEFERLAAEGHTLVVGNLYVGVAEIEDARGVRLVHGST